MSTTQGSWMTPSVSVDSTHQASSLSDTHRWMRHVRRRNARTSFVSTVDEDIALQCECSHLCNASNAFAQQGKSFLYRFS